METVEDCSSLSDREKVLDLFRVELPYYLHERANDWKFQAQQRRVCAMLDRHGGRVLDIGCGPGLMTEALVERGWEVWGVDFLEPAVAWARSRAEEAPWGRRAHYFAGDAEALSFRDARFDAVIAMGVLEYLANADRFLSEVHRVLRPGGLIVVTVPSAISPYHVVYTLLDRFVAPLYRGIRRLITGSVRRSEIPDHPRHPFTPWQLHRALVRAQFRKQAWAFTNFLFYPLERFFPDLSHRIDRRCTMLEDSPIFGWLGTQYIVAALKTP